VNIGRRRCLVELFTLCGFALAQPVLSTFGRAPDQFTFRGSSSAQIIGFGVVAVVAPALLLWGVELLAGVISDEMRVLLHRLLFVLLVAAIAVQLLPRGWARGVTIGGALAVGVLALVARERWSAVRLWLVYAAFAPLAFLLLFLFASPTAGLLYPGAPMADVRFEDQPPIVMVVFDELPLESLVTAEGEVDGDLYPNLAALADEAHWFRNATSVSPLTFHAVPAILSGRLPVDGGPHLTDHPENLFTFLGGTYDLDAREVATRLCPEDICPGRPTGEVSRWLWSDAREVLGSRLRLTDAPPDPVAAFSSDRSVFDEFVERVDGAPAALHFLHVLMPHVPYQYLPGGARYEVPPSLSGRDQGGSTWVDEEWLPRLNRQRHLAQMAFVDELLGDLFDRLRSEGAYDDALIVITADHGISFEPGGITRANNGEPLTAEATPDLLWVPLFVKEPGQHRGTVDDRNVLTVDILPTIADVLDVELPWSVDGRSALGPPRSTGTKPWRGVVLESHRIGVGEELDIDGTALLPQVLERSLGSILPPVGEPNRLWRIGPHSELVGQSASAVSERLEAVTAEVVDPASYTQGDRSELVPAFIAAHSADLEPGDAVAVVVDGRVAATGPAFLNEGQVTVAVLVDPRLVADGGETIELFRIR